MCLITFAWNPASALPLRLAANRDEFHARPTQPLAFWDSPSGILGGRDLEAGGTWLAAYQGRVAALTNVRDTRLVTPPQAPSRGEIVANALQSSDVEAWLNHLAKTQAERYAGFNLLLATPKRLWHLHRGYDGTHLAEVTPGVHGLSNATLNTPWPKLTAARHALAASDTNNWQQTTQQALHNPLAAPDERLPNTGVGLSLERQLSPAFILGERYGTRATTWLTLNAQGDVEVTEQRFGPLGRFAGETTLTSSVSGR